MQSRRRGVTPTCNSSHVRPLVPSHAPAEVQSTMSFIKRIALSSACTLAMASLSGCGGGILDPAGPVGQAEKLILFDALAIMLAIVIPTILCILAFAWYYRATNESAT